MKTKGVSYDKSRNRWVARRTENKKTVVIGRYLTEEEAIAALKPTVSKPPPVPKKITLYNTKGKMVIDTAILLSAEHEHFLTEVCEEKGYTSFSEPIAKLLDYAIRQKK